MSDSQNLMGQAFAEIDQLIRTGQHRQARLRLMDVSKTQIPNNYLALAASFWRRLYAPERGARLLFARIWDGARRSSAATQDERIEYAACLIRLGAVAEAENLLVPLGSHPQAALQLGFARICRWDYEGAIIELEKYLSSAPTSAYEYSVAKVNLVASLVACQRETEAETLLHQLRSTINQTNLLLLANLSELQAQICFARQDWAGVRNALAIAAEPIAEGESLDLLFIHKWESLCLLKEKGLAAAQESLERVKQAAASVQHWETLRDLEFQEALVSDNFEKLEYLYAGTPYLCWKKRIENIFSQKRIARDCLNSGFRFERVIGYGIVKATIDETNGRGQGGKIIFKPGQVPFRLLQALNHDFYRPVSTGELFFQIFPGEHYSPFTSANRVRQAVLKINNIFERHEIDLRVVHYRRNYSFAAKPGSAIKIHCKAAEHLSRSRLPANLKASLELFQQQSQKTNFSVGEFLERTKISRRTGQRLLNAAVQLGALTRSGRGPGTTYLFSEIR